MAAAVFHAARASETGHRPHRLYHKPCKPLSACQVVGCRRQLRALDPITRSLSIHHGILVSVQFIVIPFFGTFWQVIRCLKEQNPAWTSWVPFHARWILVTFKSRPCERPLRREGIHPSTPSCGGIGGAWPGGHWKATQRWSASSGTGFSPRFFGEDEPILTSIFFRWVGSTTN